MSAITEKEMADMNLPQAQYVQNASAVPGEPQPITAMAINVTAVPVDDGIPAAVAAPVASVHGVKESTKTVASYLGILMAILSFVFFILGCVTMNYLGFGAGAWYSAIFQFIIAMLLLQVKHSRAPKNFAIAVIVVSVLALIITFIGMVADFAWYGYSRHMDQCKEMGDWSDGDGGASDAEKLYVYGLAGDYIECADKKRDCFAVNWADGDGDGQGQALCYDANWGDCTDFCEGHFKHMAGVCGGFGLITLFLTLGASVLGCVGSCCNGTNR